jgi:hypothetical protein
MPCLVEFCRKDHPVLPDDAHVLRASGEALCPACGRRYADHEKFAYPSGMKHVVRDCEGHFLHL